MHPEPGLGQVAGEPTGNQERASDGGQRDQGGDDRAVDRDQDQQDQDDGGDGGLVERVDRRRGLIGPERGEPGDFDLQARRSRRIDVVTKETDGVFGGDREDLRLDAHDDQFGGAVRRTQHRRELRGGRRRLHAFHIGRRRG